MESDRNQSIDSNDPDIASKPHRRRTGAGTLGRFRSWLRRDPHPSIVQVMAEWAEYQLIFNDILQRLSIQLARQAKVEKKRLERLADAQPAAMEPPVQPQTTKQALRSQYAMSRYGGRVQSLLESKEARDVSIGENGSL